MNHSQAVSDQLARLTEHVRNVHDQGTYELDGKYATWQSDKLKELIAESDILIANNSNCSIELGGEQEKQERKTIRYTRPGGGSEF